MDEIDVLLDQVCRASAMTREEIIRHIETLRQQLKDPWLDREVRWDIQREIWAFESLLSE